MTEPSNLQKANDAASTTLNAGVGQTSEAAQEAAKNAAEKAAADAKKVADEEAKKPRKPRTTKYEVVKAAIAPNGGSRDALIRPGEVVELTAEQAKFYNEKGFLKPCIGD